MGYHPDVDAAMEKAIAAIKAAGAEVVDVKMPTYNDVERSGVRGAALRVQGRPQRVPEDEPARRTRRSKALIAWNKAQRRDASCRSSARRSSSRREAKGPLTDAAYLKARDAARRLAGKDGLLAALEQGQARCA